MQVIDISALLAFSASRKACNDFHKACPSMQKEEMNFKSEYSFREWWKVLPSLLTRHSQSEKLYCRALTSSAFICSEKFMKNSSRFVSANKALHRMLLLLAVSESINSLWEVIWIRGNVSKIFFENFSALGSFFTAVRTPKARELVTSTPQSTVKHNAEKSTPFRFHFIQIFILLTCSRCRRRFFSLAIGACSKWKAGGEVSATW